MNLEATKAQRGYRDWLFHAASPKDEANHLSYFASIRDSAESGLGRKDNRHLNYFAESILMNRGDSQQDVKESSPRMPVVRVGATIVVRARESRVHGEGLQFVGLF
jgi:hypothetical protein